MISSVNSEQLMGQVGPIGQMGLITVEDLYDVPVSGPHGFLLKRRDVFSFPSIGFTYAFAHLLGGLDFGYVSRTSNFDINVDKGIRVLFRLSFTP